MKKTLTLILALVVSLMTLQASAAMYIVGSAPFGGWKTNAGVQMTGSGNTYTATVDISGDAYFVFATQLCSGADDWTTFNNYRYGPKTNDYVVTVGNTYTAYSGQGSNSFKFTGSGSYTFTINSSTMQFSITSAGTPSGPDNLYILGLVNGNSWAPNTGVAMDYSESTGLYTATVTTAGEESGYSYFSFTTKLASTSDDWAGIASYRYGASGSTDYMVVENVQMPLQRGETAFKIPAGTWKFTVSLTGGYLIVQNAGGTPQPQTGDLFMLGEVNGNTWAPNIGYPMEYDENTGTFQSTVTFYGENSEEDANVSYFSFTTKLADTADDWDGIAAYRLVPNSDGDFWVTSTMLGHPVTLLDYNDNPDVSFRIPAGTYTITVNLSNRTCIITRDSGGGTVAGKGWPAMYGGVMLQGFYWDSYKATRWTSLTEQAQDLGQYFDLVWVPNSGSVDASGTAQSMGYMPVYWLKHNSCFGTESQLREMIDTFHSRNTSVMMDMVINHKSGKSGWVDFADETVTGPVTGEEYSMTWSLADICRNDECAGAGYSPTGAYDEGENFDGSRDLDHTSANVQKNVKTYQQYLMKELGYDGFRYDMCKGFAGYYVGLYNKASEPTFSVGEYWDGNAETLRWWLNETKQDDRIQTAVFDFALKYPLQSAFAAGNWSALSDKGLAADPNYQRYSVTFVDNHDTGQNTNYDCLKTNVMPANAFILTMPGTPCIFYKHYLVYTDEINNCIKARRAAGVHNQSAILTQQESSGGYILETQGTRGNLYLQVGGAVFNGTPSGYTLVQGGEGYNLFISNGIDWRHVGKDGSILGYPVVSKAAGNYVGSVALTVAPSRTGTTLVYTTDGSDPTISSATITSSTALTFTENTTLKVGVLNGDQVENVEHYVYTITSAATTGINVYVKTSMTNASIWAWTSQGSVTGTEWPGTAIKDLDKVTVNDIEWYCLHVDADQVSVIFNNGNSGFENQTSTIDVTRDAFFVYPNSDLTGLNYAAGDTYLDVTERYAGMGSASFEKVYVLGNAVSTTWSPSNGYEMTTTNGEKYTATIDFVDPYGGYSYFSFSTALGETWADIAPYRLGATSNNFLINEARLGTQLTLIPGENSFRIPVGKYNLTLYLSQKILVVEKWTEPQPVVRGDVDGNGRVNISDATLLINALLESDMTGVNQDNADCDMNGLLNITDVTALIEYLLTDSW